MASQLRPVILLADSQILFWRSEGRRFLRTVRELLAEDRPSAAYLGASNGDRREFYDLFLGAMEGVGIGDCRSIPSTPRSRDFDFLESADLILLAGGDPRRGWRVFQTTGLGERILERYHSGALLMGISAGAMQLGLYGIGEDESGPFPTFGLVPYVVDVHDEPHWRRLRGLLGALTDTPSGGRGGGSLQGLGIPSGGGALYSPRGGLEPIRYPVVEVEA